MIKILFFTFTILINSILISFASITDSLSTINDQDLTPRQYHVVEFPTVDQLNKAINALQNSHFPSGIGQLITINNQQYYLNTFKNYICKDSELFPQNLINSYSSLKHARNITQFHGATLDDDNQVMAFIYTRGPLYRMSDEIALIRIYDYNYDYSYAESVIHREYYTSSFNEPVLESELDLIKLYPFLKEPIKFTSGYRFADSDRSPILAALKIFEDDD